MPTAGSIARWEIAAPGAERLRAFYGELFGWHTEGNLVRCGQGIDGYIFEPGGTTPPFVSVYIAVDNLEETLEEAEGLGGRVYIHPSASPLSTETAYAVFGDPEGTIVGLSAASPIALQVHPNGTRKGLPVVWFEIAAEDRERARSFYAELFGWGFQPFAGDDSDSLIIDTGMGSIGGGLIRPRADGQPVAITIGVDDLDETIERAASLGASVAQPPTLIAESAGSVARLRDPGGFRFGIWTP